MRIIKKILIEINNYSFIHNPFEDSKSTNNYIGRKKQFNKLKTLLIESKSKSGVFLITGFRGMGKTSLVNNVIADISNKRIGIASIYEFLRILIFCFVTRFFLIDGFFTNSSQFIFYVPIFTVIITFILMYFQNKDRFFVLRNISQDFKSTINLIISFEKPENNNLIISFLRELCLVSIITMIMLLFKVFHKEYALFYTLIILYSCIYITTVKFVFSQTNIIIKGAWNCFSKIIYSLLFPIFLSFIFFNILSYIFIPISLKIIYFGILYFIYWKNCKKKSITYSSIFNQVSQSILYSNIVPIKINLGKDKLQEKDILTYIAKETYFALRKWHFSFKTSLTQNIYYFLFFIFILLFWYIIIYKSNSKNQIEFIENELSLSYYLPTQKLFKSIDISSPNSIKGNEIFYKFKNVDTIKLIIQNKDTLLCSHNTIKEFYGIIQKQNEYENKNSLSKIIGSIDLIILWKFNKFLKFMGSDNFVIIDYFYVLIIILSLILLRFTSRLLRYFNISSTRYTLQLLKDLVDNIDSNLEYEKSTQINLVKERMSFGGLSLRRKKSTPQFDAKAIENQLLFILNEINKIPVIRNKPQFIYIFDELDKIEPFSVSSIYDSQTETDSSSESNRQAMVIRILANLKHFLSTAKSKFIFIAGREMFDASLADTSDREAYISSIFNSVIEIPSFYSDDSDTKINDLTSFTQEFVFKYLMPKAFQLNTKLTYKDYYKYLNEQVFNNDKDKEYKTSKVIITLYNFINYLTYRSNGAPKKLTILFENFIHNPSEFEKNKTIGEFQNIIVKKQKHKLYLEFDEVDMHRFSLTSNLFSPYLVNISNFNYEIGDKLLVSLSFLIDHIFKFHPFGFSWRNLENTPEIVSLYKSPHLRSFNMEIINSLSKNHIRRIISGLHEFKFNHKTANEINYISTISEAESAAFNFTLDESRPIKKYYESKLNSITSNCQHPDKEFINSISFYRMILGDLNFYDQEYDIAIEYYLNATQSLRNIEIDKLSSDKFILLIRNFLKIGLSFERKNLYETAHTYYGQIESIIVKYRDCSPNIFGYQEFILPKKDYNIFLNKYKESLSQEDMELFSTFKDKPFIKVTGLIVNNESEKPLHYSEMKTFICLSDSIQKNINHISYSSNFHEFLYNTTLFEEFRILYQPKLAKLQLLEKEGLQGITQNDLYNTIKEFEHLVKFINEEEKTLVKAEFYNKLGDILYYKNGSFIDYKVKDCEKIKNDNIQNVKFPISALFMYYYSYQYHLINMNLKQQFDETKEISITSILTNIVEDIVIIKENLNGNPNNKINEKDIEPFVSCVIELIECILPMVERNLSNIKLLQILQDKISNINFLTHLEKIIYIYLNASDLLKLISDFHACNTIRLKLLYLINEFNLTIKNDNRNINQILENIQVRLINHTIRYSSKVYNNADVFEDSSLINLLDIKEADKKNIIKKIKYNLPSYEDAKHFILLYEKLKYNLDADCQNHSIETDIHTFSNSVNKIIYLSYCEKRSTDNKEKVYCLIEIIKTLNSQGFNYITSTPLQLSEYYKKLADVVNKINEEEKQEIEKWADYNFPSIQTSIFYYEKAIEFRDIAISMHTGGISLKEFMNKKYYLEDDLNDENIHFNFAIERLKILNIDFIIETNKLVKKQNNSRYFNYS